MVPSAPNLLYDGVASGCVPTFQEGFLVSSRIVLAHSLGAECAALERTGGVSQKNSSRGWVEAGEVMSNLEGEILAK